MATDTVEALPDGGLTIPGGVEEKTKRGRERMRQDAPARNECISFWRGDSAAADEPVDATLELEGLRGPGGLIGQLPRRPGVQQTLLGGHDGVLRGSICVRDITILNCNNMICK